MKTLKLLLLLFVPLFVKAQTVQYLGTNNNIVEVRNAFNLPKDSIGSGNIRLRNGVLEYKSGNVWLPSAATGLGQVTALDSNTNNKLGLRNGFTSGKDTGSYDANSIGYTLNGTGKMSRTETRSNFARPVGLSAIYTALPASKPTIAIDYHGLDIVAKMPLNASPLSRLYPFESTVDFTNNSGDTLLKSVSGYLFSNFAGTGSVLDAVNLRIWHRSTSSGNINSWKGIEIETPFRSAGSADSATGVYIQPVTYATRNYGIYNANFNNFFGGLNIERTLAGAVNYNPTQQTTITSNPNTAPTVATIHRAAGITHNVEGSLVNSNMQQIGNQIITENKSSGTVGLQYNSVFYNNNSGAGITTTRAATFFLSNTGTGNIGSYTGIYFPELTSPNTGKVTNHTSFNVENQPATGVTRAIQSQIQAGANRHNLYVNGTANNYLNGSLGIGVENASAKLHVVGGVRFNSDSINISTNGQFASLRTNLLTNNRSYSFPDASGTLALSDTNVVSGAADVDFSTKGCYTFTGTTAVWDLMPSATQVTTTYKIVNMGSGNLTINAPVSTLWEAGTLMSSKILATGETATIWSNGINWIIQ